MANSGKTLYGSQNDYVCFACFPPMRELSVSCGPSFIYTTMNTPDEIAAKLKLTQSDCELLAWMFNYFVTDCSFNVYNYAQVTIDKIRCLHEKISELTTHKLLEDING